ncbi:AMIN domain-containing protein [Nostoc sp. UCD121]|uniref:AMIN domain-containing protein n=1 Tax=unclassified Nostoc TaxID=2593658 RepID=UPI001627333E|nr:MULTISPECIES: AMIN domain-containing protein [unclassified Nostoc]MBC1221688.1 AMIN domain-containing protein [Nostoc sp. UCD120]MBC1275410.1 AMIN domain-containing protein [Nostoc sp. UCD121]MBC1294041.1 AMIN domain-containing protein [Nostoc sp. UCD122]
MDQGLKTRQFCQWRKQIFNISLLGFCAAIALETCTTAATPVAKLDNWRFSPKTQQLEINLSAGTNPRYFYLAQPSRLVVDLPNTKLGKVTTQQNYSGAIKSIRVSQLNANDTRIVLDLAPGTTFNPKQVQLQPVSRKNSTRWVLRPISSGKTTAAKPGKSAPSPKKQPQTPQKPPTNLPVTTTNLQAPLLTVPPISNNLPSTITNNSGQPFVTVPPLTSNTSSQQPALILPPPSFPNQPGNLNSVPPSVTSEFPVPTIPNVSNPQVIEFGQPLPKTK